SPVEPGRITRQDLRSMQHRLFRTLVTLLAITACSGTLAQLPEKLPDIDVTYIERTPRYPGYQPDYDVPGSKGVPILLDAKTRRPLTQAQLRAIKRWPAAGDVVTFTAHIQNRGNAAAPAHD